MLRRCLMEWGDEEAAQESTRRGPRQIGWFWSGAKPKSEPIAKMAARAAWSKAARKESQPGATPDAHDRDGESRAPLDSVCAMSPIEGSEPAVQLSFLCPCGSRIALKTFGCCRSCYDRRHHSLRFFGGLRERVLVRDRFRCRGCGKRSALVVHHRDQRNRTNVLVTLC